MVRCGWRSWRIVCRAVLAAAVALPLARGTANAHPLHTTMTEITAGPAPGALHIVIRVFADDFQRASAPVGGDVMAYLRRTFVLRSGARVLSLRPCGTRRSGELLWICVDASAPSANSPIELRDALLCELYDDQVNLVRSLVGTVPRSILFTRGDRPKPIQ